MSKDFVFIENGLVKYEDYSRLIDKCEKALKDNRIKDKEIEKLKNIIKEVREVLENKREIMTSLLLNDRRCNYEELLYQLDEEIRNILDRVGSDKE